MARKPIVEKEIESPPRAVPLRQMGLLLLGFVVLACVVYGGVLRPGRILFTTDDNIGAIALRKSLLPQAFFGGWDDSAVAGQAFAANISWTNLLVWLLPVRVFVNTIHALDVVLGSFFFALFLRRRNLGLVACALGALTAFWFGSNFFLTYAGHIGKFGVLVFAALALWLSEKAVQDRSIPAAALAGAAVGAMFLEQADVALFIAMGLGPYMLFRCIEAFGRRAVQSARLLLPWGLLAALLAFHPVWSAYSLFAMDDGAKGGESGNEAELWNYCTQWSWPPEETIEWLAPGYMGWRTMDPRGPYWGRMGRDAEWDRAKEGVLSFRHNFKLETLYLGVVPLVLAAFAIWMTCRRARHPRHERMPEVLFWSALALVTFLLGLGKFFPLYRLFFALPGISSIRNPVKFMQVTQLALAVLAAIGMDAALRLPKPESRDPDAEQRIKRFLRGSLAAAFLLLLWAVALSMTWDASRQVFGQQGWGVLADAIVKNRVWGIMRATGMAFVAYFFVSLLAGRAFGGRAAAKAVIAWSLVGLVVADQYSVSRLYVQTVGVEGYIEKNEVVEFLQPRLGAQRALLLTRGDFYNEWLSILFPYYGISTFNVPQMRMPEDYKRFFEVVGANPYTLWRHFAVGYLLGPSAALRELQSIPDLRDAAEVVYAYNAIPVPGGVKVERATQQRPGQHIVLRQKREAPRYGLLAGWEAVSDDEALQRLASEEELFQVAYVSPEVAARLPVSEGRGLTGSVDVRSRRAGEVELQVSTEKSAILRLSEKYAREWKAFLNGRPAELFRCDYLFQGVLIPPGLHTVVVRYAPPKGSLFVQALGMALALAAAGILAAGRLRARPLPA